MVRLGKWGENKIQFRDSTIGRRGLQWPWERADARYRLCWFREVRIPARGTATNIGGSARFTRSRGGAGIVIGNRMGSYCTSAWGHGIASVEGWHYFLRGGFGGNQRATAPNSWVVASLLNASTIRFSLNNYTAATLRMFLLVWGATAQAY